MNLIILSVILAVGLPTAGFPEDVPDDLTLTDQTISIDRTYTANKSITAGPVVNVQGNANDVYPAQQRVLNAIH